MTQNSDASVKKRKWSTIFFMLTAASLFLSAFEFGTGHTFPSRLHPEFRKVGANEPLYMLILCAALFGIACIFKGSEPDDPPPRTGSGPGLDGIHESED